eukprot:4447859-Prymnesium_polylepis.2
MGHGKRCARAALTLTFVNALRTAAFTHVSPLATPVPERCEREAFVLSGEWLPRASLQKMW